MELKKKVMKTFRSCLKKSLSGMAGASAIASVQLFLTPAFAGTSYYQQTNLVSDLPGLAANTDANLVNPWGVSFGPAGPFWVSGNATGVTSLYNSGGTPLPLVVTIPPPGGSPPGTASKPTGQVFNGSANFALATGASRFIFATEDGTIAAWNAGTTAALVVDNSASAVYKGLGIDSSQSNLYAANFSSGKIDKFGSSFNYLGSFADPTLPAGYAPFNVQNLNGKLYVAYAKQNPGTADDEPGLGNGFVDIFDPGSNTFARLVSQGVLDSPWGLAIAPADFGSFSNDLLVGNFGDGRINAYDPVSGNLLGQLSDAQGMAIQIDGLWALTFGNGGNAGSKNALYFTAGINNEADGLFGKLEAKQVPAVPDPFSILGAGMAARFAHRFRKRTAKIRQMKRSQDRNG
jgi:uncharacterized protein (TIGR03118 family)